MDDAWNRCPSCDALVDCDEVHDGSERRCGCGMPLVVVEYDGELLPTFALEYNATVLAEEAKTLRAKANEVPGLTAELDQARWERDVARGEHPAYAQALEELDRRLADAEALREQVATLKAERDAYEALLSKKATHLVRRSDGKRLYPGIDSAIGTTGGSWVFGEDVTRCTEEKERAKKAEARTSVMHRRMQVAEGAAARATRALETLRRGLSKALNLNSFNGINWGRVVVEIAASEERLRTTALDRTRAYADLAKVTKSRDLYEEVAARLGAEIDVTRNALAHARDQLVATRKSTQRRRFALRHLERAYLRVMKERDARLAISREDAALYDACASGGEQTDGTIMAERRIGDALRAHAKGGET